MIDITFCVDPETTFECRWPAVPRINDKIVFSPPGPAQAFRVTDIVWLGRPGGARARVHLATDEGSDDPT
jgi:hypothetical protein